MRIFGKIFGAFFGFMVAGVFGAIFGLFIGHMFDKGFSARILEEHASFNSQEQTQKIFFKALFLVLGHLAKADGHVSKDEIELAQAIMRDMSLDDDKRQSAIDLFNKGKQADFDMYATLDEFRRACTFTLRKNLLQMYLELLIHAAYADGVMHPQEQKLLETISIRLGFSIQQFNQIESMVQAQQSFSQGFHHGSQGQRSRSSAPPRQDKIKQAYKVLGISESASDAEVKKAYRRQINQHHPDKLVAKGLPEEMIKLANEKSHEITAAYETLKSARRM